MSSENPQKKLKQGRLPFAPVDPKSSKKRRLPSEEETSKSPKIFCLEEEKSQLPNKDGESKVKTTSAKRKLNDISDKNESNLIEEKENLKKKNAKTLNEKHALESINKCQNEESNDGVEALFAKEGDSKDKKSCNKSQPEAKDKVSDITSSGQSKDVDMNTSEPSTKSLTSNSRSSKKSETSKSQSSKKPETSNSQSSKKSKTNNFQSSKKSETSNSQSSKESEPSHITQDKGENKQIVKQSKESEKTSDNQTPKQKRKRTSTSKKQVQSNSLENMFKKIDRKQSRPNFSKSSPGNADKLQANDTDIIVLDSEEEQYIKFKKNAESSSVKSVEIVKDKMDDVQNHVSRKAEERLNESEKKDENITESDESLASRNTDTIEKGDGDEINVTLDLVDINESNCSSLNTSNLSHDGDISGHSTASPRTPFNDRKLLVTKKNKITSAQKKLQEEKMKKRVEMEKLKAEKQKEKEMLKEEKLKKKQDDVDAKNKVKEKLIIKKEQERQRKEEKKEEERLKKEEEKQKKEEERLRKEEEKLKKEEEKLKREEEKLKREQEKLQAEEEERDRKEKLKAKFVQFFVPKKSSDSPPLSQGTEDENERGNFSLFQVKGNMRIAPLVRRFLGSKDRNVLDSLFTECSQQINSIVNYISQIRSSSYTVGKSSRTFPYVDYPDDCEILSEDGDEYGVVTSISDDVLEIGIKWTASSSKRRRRAKLLQFCENRRPSFYGTWSKTSTKINGRNPLGREEEIFDYDYDSDEDWEEEENGESLSDSDADADEGPEELNQYEVDNEFFVPHGYLSDGEGEEEEKGRGEKKEEEEEDETGEEDKAGIVLQKEKLKQKQEEFDLEMKQKTKQLKPTVFGCVWLGDVESHIAYDQLLKILSTYKSKVLFGSVPIDVKAARDYPSSDSPAKADEEEENSKKFVKTFPEEAVPDLIRLLHGNPRSKLYLVREFCEFWKQIKLDGNVADESKNSPGSGALAMRKIALKIQEICQYERIYYNDVPLKYKTWNVPQDVRAKYELEDLNPLANPAYIMKEEKRAACKEDTPAEDNSSDHQPPVRTMSPRPPAKNLITKFTKVLDEEDRRKLSSPTHSDLVSKKAKIPNLFSKKLNIAPNSTPKTPKLPTSVTKEMGATTPVSSRKTIKKKLALIPVDKDKETSCPSTPNPIIALFKNSNNGPQIKSSKPPTEPKTKPENDDDMECITLE